MKVMFVDGCACSKHSWPLKSPPGTDDPGPHAISSSSIAKKTANPCAASQWKSIFTTLGLPVETPPTVVAAWSDSSATNGARRVVGKALHDELGIETCW